MVVIDILTIFICKGILHGVHRHWFGNRLSNVNYGSTQNIKIIYHFYEQQVEPDFKMNDQFVIENLQYVFGIDALETSRPINIEVNTPEEISSLFDAISYEKGTWYKISKLLITVQLVEWFHF